MQLVTHLAHLAVLQQHKANRLLVRLAPKVEQHVAYICPHTAQDPRPAAPTPRTLQDKPALLERRVGLAALLQVAFTVTPLGGPRVVRHVLLVEPHWTPSRLKNYYFVVVVVAASDEHGGMAERPWPGRL